MLVIIIVVVLLVTALIWTHYNQEKQKKLLIDLEDLVSSVDYHSTADYERVASWLNLHIASLRDYDRDMTKLLVLLITQKFVHFEQTYGLIGRATV